MLIQSQSQRCGGEEGKTYISSSTLKWLQSGPPGLKFVSLEVSFPHNPSPPFSLSRHLTPFPPSSLSPHIHTPRSSCRSIFWTYSIGSVGQVCRCFKTRELGQLDELDDVPPRPVARSLPPIRHHPAPILPAGKQAGVLRP
jgi:hypothetical protein